MWLNKIASESNRNEERIPMWYEKIALRTKGVICCRCVKFKVMPHMTSNLVESSIVQNSSMQILFFI